MLHLLNSQSVLQANDDTLLLDVRSPVEYQKGHIPSAISLPLSVMKRKKLSVSYTKKGTNRIL